MAEKEAALFVDGANWSKSLSDLGMRVDYKKLVFELQQVTGTKITSLHYYTTYKSQESLDRRWAFLNSLKGLGWEVFAIPAKINVVGKWHDKEIDIGIAIDAYETIRSGYAQDLIIGTGDGDFAALFRRLPAEVGKWAIGFKDAMSPMLKDVANVILMERLNILHKKTVAEDGETNLAQGHTN